MPETLILSPIIVGLKLLWFAVDEVDDIGREEDARIEGGEEEEEEEEEEEVKEKVGERKEIEVRGEWVLGRLSRRCLLKTVIVSLAFHNSKFHAKSLAVVLTNE